MKLETAQKIYEKCGEKRGEPCGACPLWLKGERPLCHFVDRLLRLPEGVCPECKGRGWTLHPSSSTQLEVECCYICHPHTRAQVAYVAYDIITEALEKGEF